MADITPGHSCATSGRADQLRPAPAQGRRHDGGRGVLVPAADRGAQRGAGRRPRAAAAVPRPHGRLPGRHRAGDGHLPGRRPGARRAGSTSPSTRGRACGGPRRSSRSATLLAELAQQPALDLLAADAARRGADRRHRAGARARSPRAWPPTRGSPRPASPWSAPGWSRSAPEPELERALQTPTREQVQQEADRATYARRALAVEQERAIAENELQNQIELARREQQLVEQQGANARRARPSRRRRRARSTPRRGRRPPPAESGRGRERPRRDAARASAPPRPSARRPGWRRTASCPTAMLWRSPLEELAGKLPRDRHANHHARTCSPTLLARLDGRSTGR